MNHKEKIVGAFVSPSSVTLYKEDGQSIVLVQSDPKLPYVMENIIPQLREKGFADFTPAKKTENIFAAYENTSSVIKFFSVVKSKVQHLFAMPLEEEKLGTTPSDTVSAESETTPTFSTRLEERKKEELEKVISEATPCTSDAFDMDKFIVPVSLNANNSRDEETEQESDVMLVAKVGDTVIPNAERLAAQVAHSVKHQNTVGLDNLLKRLAKVIGNRDHTIDDITRFIELADLPISDNGDIIVYKMVNYANHQVINSIPDVGFDKTKVPIYADCHTGKVAQWVGAMVVVPEGYVDRNRKQECSQGLHVARRGYLSNFSGAVCLLCVLRPEDIIAVPNYDAKKVRVAAYHIIDVLTNEEKNSLRKGNSMVVNEASRLKLERALGNHYPSPTHVVSVTGAQGTGISYNTLGVLGESQYVNLNKPEVEQDETTPVFPEIQQTGEKPAEEPTHVDSLDNVIPVEESSTVPVNVDIRPQEILDMPKEKAPKKAKATKKKETKVKPPKQSFTSPRALIQDILKTVTPETITEEQKARLIALKKQAKKGWAALGVPDNISSLL